MFEFVKKPPQTVGGLLDVHTHILPGMDDGSASAEESLEMLALSRAQGVEHLALTPHFYARRESPGEFLARRTRAQEKLTDAAKGKKDIPILYAGAEVEFFDGISRVEEIKALCIGDSGVLLVEMPFCKWNRKMIEELLLLRDNFDVLPMLAHIERYLAWSNEEMLDELLGEDILIQANASFFLRDWWASRTAFRMLKERRIHLLGSDCHNMSRRPPNLAQAVERIRCRGSAQDIEYLMNMQKLIVLSDEEGFDSAEDKRR